MRLGSWIDIWTEHDLQFTKKKGKNLLNPTFTVSMCRQIRTIYKRRRGYGKRTHTLHMVSEMCIHRTPVKEGGSGTPNKRIPNYVDLELHDKDICIMCKSDSRL